MIPSVRAILPILARHGLTTGGVVHTHLGQRQMLQLFCQFQGVCGSLPGPLLCFWSGGKTQEDVAAQPVMVALVWLDDIAIQSSRGLMAIGFAPLDELLVLHHRDRLARE